MTTQEEVKTEHDELRDMMLVESARSAGRMIAHEAMRKLTDTIRLYTQGDYTNDHVSFQTKEERLRFWDEMKTALGQELEDHN